MPIVGCLMQQLQRQCSVTYAKKKNNELILKLALV